MSLKKHYSPYNITNEGEQALDKLITESLLYDKEEEWHVFYNMRIAKHITKKTGEGDFVFLNKRGLIVMEVKGGLIEYKENTFYYAANQFFNLSKRMDESPFVQADDNAASIIKHLKEKQIRDCVVSHAVAFPQSTFNYDGISFDNFWHLGIEDTFRNFLLEILEKGKRIAKWKVTDLNSVQINNIIDELSPKVIPDQNLSHLLQSSEKAKKRLNLNKIILDGLIENKRIIIQGPPGSGKSSYALSHMIRKTSQGEKGLYLCWNELLAAHIKNEVMNKGLLKNMEVFPLYKFVQKLLKQAGLDEKELSYTNIDTIPDFILKAIAELKSKNSLAHFDFIVLDEAQDLFDKGVDVVLNNLLADGENGMSIASYLVLYDMAQAFSPNYTKTLSLLKHHAAHYKLYENYRATGGEGLNEFIAEIGSGTIDFTKKFGHDVVIQNQKNENEIIPAVKKIIDSHKKHKNLNEQLAVLFSSNLIGIKNNVKRQLQTEIEKDNYFELLTPSKLGTKNHGFWYTSSLKFKGLERDIIILVIKDILNEKSNIMLQLLIGASRAKVKLYVLVC